MMKIKQENELLITGTNLETMATNRTMSTPPSTLRPLHGSSMLFTLKRRIPKDCRLQYSIFPGISHRFQLQLALPDPERGTPTKAEPAHSDLRPLRPLPQSISRGMSFGADGF